MPGSNEEGDGFGYALALLDHDGDGRAFGGAGARDLGLGELGFPRESFAEFGPFGFILGER